MNSRARLSGNRGCQGTKKERETLNKLQIDTIPVSLNSGPTTAMLYTTASGKIGEELNYGSVDSALSFSPFASIDFNS